MIEGKNEGMSTTELAGGARIHYIFQSIFVKSLEVRIFYLYKIRYDIILFSCAGFSLSASYSIDNK